MTKHSSATSLREKNRRRIGTRNLLDQLEPRTLLSAVTITGYNPDFFSATSGAYDANGQLWMANNSLANGGEIDSISTDAQNNLTLTPVISVPDASVFSFVINPVNGKFYYVDHNGAPNTIDEVDPANPTAAPVIYSIPDSFGNSSEYPTALAATADGAIWFTEAPEPSNVANAPLNMFGRLNPTTGSVALAQVGDAIINTDDSLIAGISANGNGIYIGLGSANTPVVGHNHIAAAAFNGSNIQITAAYNVNTGNAIADQYGIVSSVATASDGSVWFSLANTDNGSGRPQHPADRLVHGVVSGGNLNQTAYIVAGAVDNNALGVGNISIDGAGRLWFNEADGNAVGILDTTAPAAAGAYTITALPDGPGGPTTFPEVLVSNPNAGATSAWVTTESAGYTLMKVDVAGGNTTIPFSGSAVSQSYAEDHQYNGIPLATFSANPGTYTAHVIWGDGTTADVTPVSIGTNSWAVLVNKKFSTQSPAGGYVGSVVITNTATNTVAGTLTFTSIVNDTPLSITSDTATALFLRIVTLTATFTDDVDGSASQFTAKISWGDGTTSNGLIIANPFSPGTYLVVALHQYSKKGAYSVKTTILTTEANAVLGNNIAITSVIVH